MSGLFKQRSELSHVFYNHIRWNGGRLTRFPRRFSGKDQYAQRVFRNLNPAIGDEQAYELGAKLGRLQEYTVAAVVRQDASDLIAE